MNKRNAVVISCVYPPQPFTSARTSCDMAAFFSDKRMLVTVICPLIPQQECTPTLEGVYRVYQFTSKRSRLGSRFLQNVSFGLSSAWKLLREGPFDVAYINTWPLFAQFITVLTARMTGAIVIRSVQDLYPESLAIQGRLKNHKGAIYVLKRLDEWIGRLSHLNVYIGHSMLRLARDSRASLGQTSVIPNWINPTEWRPVYAKSQYDHIYITYAGNVGVASGLLHWLTAICRMPCDKSWLKIRILGDGELLPAIREFKQNVPGFSIDIHSPWVSGDFSALDSSSLGLITMLPGQGGVSVPSKFLTYLARELPMLALGATGNEVVDIIRSERIGWVVENEHELSTALDEIGKMSELDWSAMIERVVSVRSQFNAQDSMAALWNDVLKVTSKGRS